MQAAPTEGTIVPRRIVAIGASAGGLAALERLFRSIKDPTGDAFVVIQHLSPNFKSLMGELLSGFAGIPARLAEDRMWVEPDHIYVIPPGKDLEIKQGRLSVIRRAPNEGLHLPIDRFFASLAPDARARAVGVILSGTGSDGSRGIVEVSRFGGAVYVQAPESAAFDGMPRAAVRAKVATLVDTPEQIAEALIQAPVSGAPPPALQPKLSAGLRRGLPADAGDLAPIFEALIERFDLDFSEYKLGTVSRRIERRLALRDCESVHAYSKLLRQDDAELDALWRDFLIGVTCFFRDEEAFTTIERDVVPQLLESRMGDAEIRVWVPGCATGEEVYSLAILLDEAVRAHTLFSSFRLFATDVNRAVLDRASRGYFEAEAVAGVSAARLHRYFEPNGPGFMVVPELRRRVVFAEHNLLTDPPFTRIDLVSCRNLLIYLLPDAQERVLGKLEFALRDRGFLFLGPSESLAAEGHTFDAIDRTWRIFRKAGEARGVSAVEGMAPRMSARALRVRGPMNRMGSLSRPVRNETESLLSKVVDRFAPSGFLIDGQRTVLHIFGDAGRYLNVSGPVSLDIVTLVRSELQLVLTTAIHAALREHRSTHLTASTDEGELRIGVDCIHSEGDPEPLMLVRIERTEEVPSPDAPNVAVTDLAAQRIRDLEEDLAETRLNLQAVVEELETSNEELQATNEELLASNEELQSTNEELQSVNEELHTVNAEYEKKNEDLLELTQDLTMLMDCTSIGMVFLGPELEVRKFTPAIDAVYPLRAQDVGRPLADMTDRLQGDQLAIVQNAREVLRTGRTREREVQTAEGRPLLEQIHANRGREGQARGVAITYVDLTSVKQAEAALRRSEARSQSVLNALAANVAVIDQHGTIVAVNGRWTDFADFNGMRPTPPMGLGTNYLAACVQAAGSPEEVDAQKALVGIQSVLSGRSTSFEQVYPCHAPDEERWFLMRVTPLQAPEVGAVIAHIDVTELERLRQSSVRSAERLELLGAAINAATEGVMICDADLTVRYVNPSFEKMVSVASAVAVGRALGHLEALAPCKALQEKIAAHERWEGEVDISVGERVLQLEATLSPILDFGGQARQVVCVFRDVGEQRSLEQSLRHSQKMEAIGTLAGGIAHDFNNLLGAIMGYADLLAEDLSDDAPASDDLRQIRQASHRARDLVEQILTFSRKTEGKKERVQPHLIVRECKKLLRGSIPSSVEIEGEVDDSGWVDVDPTQLHQVVMNLATNAYQAIGAQSGAITISLQAVGPHDEHGRALHAELVVADDGTGMPADVRERAFEPFYTTKTDGTGMGLAVVHGIVSRLGGKIELTSEVGEGTSVRVRLPTTLPPSATAAPRPAKGTGGSELVYIVDDEPALVRLVERMLQRDGYRVEAFTSAFKLLERLDEAVEEPDLVLCDHAMPKMTGAALLNEFRARGASFPVVLMSGYTLGAGIQRELRDKFAEVLKKPFRRDDLAACVRRVLDAAEPTAVG